MNTLFTALRGLLHGTAFIAVWGWIELSVRTYDDAFPLQLPASSEIFGVLLMTAGITLALLCLGFFAIRGRGTAAPFDPPREFVAAGPYLYVRNPMYIGGWLMFLGFGLYERSVSMTLFSIVWFLLAHLFVLYYEEPGLEKRYGESYLRYKKAVNRWIPHLIKRNE